MLNVCEVNELLCTAGFETSEFNLMNDIYKFVRSNKVIRYPLIDGERIETEYISNTFRCNETSHNMHLLFLELALECVESSYSII